MTSVCAFSVFGRFCPSAACFSPALPVLDLAAGAGPHRAFASFWVLDGLRASLALDWASGGASKDENLLWEAPDE